MATPNSLHNDLFSSLVSDIKSYSGKDPLLPWLRGIKKMKESLPSRVLREKLPRFLQKCTQAFQSDRRYRNDSRYLRVWLQLMDYVDEPKALLRTMEMNYIGTECALFYQAYALCYEKMKKFDEAEKMYHLGVQNLAEPVGELQKSYELFLHRMERHKNKKIQHHEGRTGERPVPAGIAEQKIENTCSTNDRPKTLLNGCSQNVKPTKESNHPGASEKFHRKISKKQLAKEIDPGDEKMVSGDDTFVGKFVGTAIDGKSEAEDARHHGLVDPTIYTREAINAINSMFREPLETAPIKRRGQSNLLKKERLNNGFNIFIDDDLDNGSESHHQNGGVGILPGKAQTCQPHREPLQIFVDNEGGGNSDRTDDNDNLELSEVANLVEGSHTSATHNAFVFPRPKDLASEGLNHMDVESSSRVKIGEDTVVRKFVGSTILDEPVVEDVCHHGLVDPTINLKEAMDDINNMFGKPMDFVRAKRSKGQDKAPARKQDLGGFSILPDENLECQQAQPPEKSFGIRDADLFEPTVFTKEAMDDINKMFGMPLDF